VEGRMVSVLDSEIIGFEQYAPFKNTNALVAAT
jgi:hypothetical protein